MSRPPRARQRILHGAYRLVRAGTVRRLTLARLAQSSGVARGAVLYHWPSRRALIRGLVQHDLDALALAGEAAGDGDRLVGRIRAQLDPGDGIGMLAAGLMSEAREDPECWSLIQRTEADLFRGSCWDDVDVARYVLLLAAEGASWRRVHDLAPDVPALDDRVRATIERWLGTVTRPDA